VLCNILALLCAVGAVPKVPATVNAVEGANANITCSYNLEDGSASWFAKYHYTK